MVLKWDNYLTCTPKEARKLGWKVPRHGYEIKVVYEGREYWLSWTVYGGVSTLYLRGVL
jgi:hypothetical protein